MYPVFVGPYCLCKQTLRMGVCLQCIVLRILIVFTSFSVCPGADVSLLQSTRRVLVVARLFQITSMFQSDSELEQVSNSDLSPMLKRVLSSRVLYAVSLPPPRRKNGIWKVHFCSHKSSPRHLIMFVFVW